MHAGARVRDLGGRGSGTGGDDGVAVLGRLLDGCGGAGRALCGRSPGLVRVRSVAVGEFEGSLVELVALVRCEMEKNASVSDRTGIGNSADGLVLTGGLSGRSHRGDADATTGEILTSW